MNTTLQIDCPPELLLGLHMDAKRLTELVKLHAAVALFKDGQLSSGMAARWCDQPRTVFLMHAMHAGAQLLDNSDDDYNRETALL